jgi:catechol 1,2-dioxygenase
MTNEEAFRTFIGGWQLVSCINHHSDGSEDHPIGPNPLGQIMYSLDGHMTAQLIRTTQSEAKPLDLPYVQNLPDYAGYFGNFTVDAGKGVVTHHVAGSSSPGMVGTDQERHFRFEGDKLLLRAEAGADRFEIVWQKRDATTG